MKVVTLLAQKGGSGKSTAAINLAIAAEEGGGRRGRRAAAIVDAVPQASAAAWRFQRAAETPAVALASAAVPLARKPSPLMNTWRAS